MPTPGCPICNSATSNRLRHRPRPIGVFRQYPTSDIKERVMKSLITGGLLVASLALTGNAAPAPNTPAHKIKPAVRHIVTRQPLGEPNADIGQFIGSIFGGGPLQYQALM